MKPTIEQVIAFAQSDLDDVKPPSPYDIALTMGAALLAAGRFTDDAGAAMVTAWTLVIPFYQGELAYKQNVRAQFDIAQHASQAEGSMGLRDLMRAAGVGGETGETGEIAPISAAAGKDTMTVGVGPNAKELTVAEVHARNERISDATRKCQEAWTTWQAAEAEVAAGGGETAVKKAAKLKKAFDKASQAQSTAYL